MAGTCTGTVDGPAVEGDDDIARACPIRPRADHVVRVVQAQDAHVARVRLDAPVSPLREPRKRASRGPERLCERRLVDGRNLVTHAEELHGAPNEASTPSGGQER